MIRRAVVLGVFAFSFGVATAPTVVAEPYYKNCSEARAAGAAPIREGEPGYRKGLDRDGDGIACE